MAPGFAAQVIADARVAAKAYARVQIDDEDALFDTLAATALALAESFLRTSVIVRPHRAVLGAGRRRGHWRGRAGRWRGR